MRHKDIEVLYEPEIFLAKAYGGVARYFAELLKQYSFAQDVSVTLPLLFTDNYYLLNLFPFKYFALTNKSNYRKTQAKKSFYSKITRKLQKRIKQSKERINLYIQEKNYAKGSFDVCHLTYYNTDIYNHLHSTPIVITIYDMIYEIFSDEFPSDHKVIIQKKDLIGKADKIIAISNHTKKDLMKLYDVNSSKIDVIYRGCSLHPERIHAKSSLILPTDFILFVGKRRGYKNFDKFLLATADILREKRQLHLVCAGGRCFRPDETQMIQTLGLKNKVHHFVVTDDELAELYQKAKFLVLPSKYEGFGLPLLEAFRCGCPVACSQTSSLTEIAQNAAVYFDPDDEHSIRASIKELLDKQSLQSLLVKHGLDRIKEFTWQKTASKTKAAYKSII